MKKLFTASFMAVFLVFSLTAAFSQENKPQTVKMRKEIVKLKFIRAQDASILLRPFASRDVQMQITWSPSNESLMVISDYPEIVEKMLDILKEIDVKPVDLLFTVQLVLGSESGEGKTDEYLQNDPIVNELKKLLRYKTFTLLDTNLMRTLDQRRAEITLGKNTEFNLRISPKYVKEEKEEIIQMEVRLNRKDQQTYFTPDQKPVTTSGWTTLIETQLTMKSGDKTVVGVSKLDGADKGLILIISGKAIT